MIVKTKDEKLARALYETHLVMINFPAELVKDKVNEYWPGYLNQARFINAFLGNISNDDLDGETTQEKIDEMSKHGY